MPVVTGKGRQPGDGGVDTVSNQKLVELQPDHLRNLVFNYLCHNCYLKTAQAFAKDSAVRHLDKDGDEIGDAPGMPVGSQGSSTDLSDETVRHILVRQRIQLEILSGNIEEAIALLQQHFPKVLASDDTSETEGTVTVTAAMVDENSNPERAEFIGETVNPVHLSLNLRILALIEACRTVPLAYTPRPHDMESPLSPDLDAAPPRRDQKEEDKRQEELLIFVQKLYTTINDLKQEDRAIYSKELWNVGGLLAYTVPEKSPMAKYLHQERRERVAEQINSAILHHAKMPSVSFLELAVRYTHCLWDTLHELRVRVPAAHKLKGCLPPGSDESEKETSQEARPFDLQLFLNART